MTWIALKMLTGDRSKYFAIVFGVTFACFLIAEQSAIFCGVMLRTTSQIRDTHGADIWVMNPGVRYVDDLKAISDDDVYRVRGVPGVAWAVNLYRGQGQAQLADGNYQGVILMGVDDATPGRGTAPHARRQARRPAESRRDHRGRGRLPPDVAGRAAAHRQGHRDERPPGRGRRRLPRLADLHDHADRLHALQPGDAVRAALPPADALRAGQVPAGVAPEEVARRIEAQTGLKALSKRRVHPTDHELLPAAHGHPASTSGPRCCWPSWSAAPSPGRRFTCSRSRTSSSSARSRRWA